MQLTEEQKEAIRAVLEYLEEDRQEYRSLFGEPDNAGVLDKHIGKHLDVLEWLLWNRNTLLPCAFCERPTLLGDMFNWPRPGMCEENYMCGACIEKLKCYTEKIPVKVDSDGIPY
jgi:hypothetical protein